MRKKQKNRLQSIWRIYLPFIIAGILILAGVFGTVTWYDKKTTVAKAETVLDFLESSCNKYDDYQLGNHVKDLQTVLNKARVLSRYKKGPELKNRGVLWEYAKYQNLTGIFILDSRLKTLCHVNVNGDSGQELLRTVLADNNGEMILKYPRKTYSDRIQVGEKYYNYAMVSREDETGLVICYSDVTRFNNDRYELTLNTLLSNDEFPGKASILITDGKQILSTNTSGPAEKEKDVVISSLQKIKNRWNPGSLTKLRYQGDDLYGMHRIYQNYFLYVFYRSESVFQNRGSALWFTLGIYLLLCFTLLTWQEYKKRQKLRDEAEKATMANEAKTAFLRRMSHDVRTPVNGIRGMVSVAESCIGDQEKTKECLGKIREVSDFLLDMLNNMLDMSKMESCGIHLDNRSFNLRDVFHQSLTMVETQAQEGGITLEAELSGNSSWHVMGSPLHVERVFQNILSNAVKYNKENGSIKVSLREMSVEGETAEFAFVCADTGIGMSPEFQKHAFDTFTQEEDGARTNYAGSGLGLSIARKLTEAMGGTIRFVSEEGEGTVFTVLFRFQIDRDFREAQEPSEKTEKGIPDGEQRPVETIHVLLVEDNELNMEIAEYMLREKGLKISKAFNGREALEFFERSAPGSIDAILMDIMMPVMDGLEATRQIRSLPRADAEIIPILAMSANSFSDDIRRSREAGMNEHLSKPLDFDKVYEMILRYTEKGGIKNGKDQSD